MSKYLFFICLVSNTVLGQGLKKVTISEKTLFSLGTKTVSPDEFIYVFHKNHMPKTDETKDGIDKYFDLFVKFKLKVAEAEARGMDTTKAFVRELSGYKEELKKPYLEEEDVLERLTKQAYQRMEEEVKVSHILINVKPDALPSDTIKSLNKLLAIKKRVEAGENFEKLARELSEDPSAKSNGGNLGYFTALQMVFPFEEAAFNGEVGGIAGPIRTKFGYHLLKINDRRLSRGQVEVSHILITGKLDDSKKRIDEIYDRLLKGGDWIEFCKEYSQDPGTKDNGGRLKPFGTGALLSAPVFEEIAFSLTEPGSYSSPFSTSFGWHIIRLEKKIPLPSYESMEESLKRRIARDERMQLLKSKRLARRKRELGYDEFEEVKDVLFDLSDSTLAEGNRALLHMKNFDDRNLFKIADKLYPVTGFLKFVKSSQRPTNLSMEAYLQQLFDEFVNEKLSEAEDSLLQIKYPEYRHLVKEYREGILLFSIMEKEVWIKASDDSLGQRRFYETNLDKYTAGERVRAQMFGSEDITFLEEIKPELFERDTLEKEALKKFKKVQTFQTYEKNENKVIDNISWTVGWHEAEADGICYLVEITEKIPPGYKEFEEVRANIISDYQDFLEQKWLEDLAVKYPVKVDKKIMKQVTKKILTD